MMPSTTHHPKSPRIIRDRLRLFGLLTTGLFLIVIIVMLSITLAKNTQKRGIGRTTEEMLAGGQRFLDYFYSFNSRSVEEDQYFAIAMMGNAEVAQERTDYLARNDFIRQVKRSNIKSHIDWENVEREVLKSDKPGKMKVSFKGDLVLNSRLRKKWHMILYLTPAKQTDKNSSGVQVYDYIDVSEEPQFGGS